jgi:hypothetical protein
MELTYDVMMETVKRFFGEIKLIRPSKDPGCVERFRDYFATDFLIRRGRPPEILTRDQWTDHCCKHEDVYIAECILEPYPLGHWCDEKKKIVTTYLIENKRDPNTWELLGSFIMLEFIEFKLENGKPKMWRQLITHVASLYSTDVIPSGQKGPSSKIGEELFTKMIQK